jgi:hypothetical protein
MKAFRRTGAAHQHFPRFRGFHQNGSHFAGKCSNKKA